MYLQFLEAPAYVLCAIKNMFMVHIVVILTLFFRCHEMRYTP